MMISYVIPVYNGSASIGRCIEAILNQRGEFDRQVIVVDDGSVDGTSTIVSKYPVNLYKRPHAGASSTRNFGISRSEGDYLVLVDADTFLDCSWTEQCLDVDPESYDVLCTNDLNYHETDPVCRQIMEKIRKNPYVSCDNLIGFIGNGNFIPKRSIPLIVYDEMYYVGGEDMDLMLTLIEKGVRIKAILGPSFVHKHAHRSQAIKYLSFVRKKVLFAYGNVRTGLKHPNSEYARRDAMNNWWIFPLYPFLWLYKKLIYKDN